jgi:hypothetical protein
VLFIHKRPSLTGLTGATHRSDRCKALWVLSRVNIMCEFPTIRPVLLLFRVGLSFWGFLT